MNQKGAADWLLGGRCDSQPLFSLWILSVHLNSGLSEHRVFVFPYLGPEAHRPRDWLVANLCEIGHVGHKEGVASKVSLIALLCRSLAVLQSPIVFMKHGDVSADTCIYSQSDGEVCKLETENVRLQNKSCVLPLQSLKCAAFTLKANTVCFCFAGVCEYLQTCLCVLCKLLIITASDCC